jgi:hypothetical protein
MQGSVYPKALVELECTLEDIKTAATKRTRPKDEDNWCQAVANHGKTLVPRPPRTSVEATQGDCHEDGAQSKIVAGEGWGPVRIGAAAKAVDAFLGEAKSVRRYSNVHIKDYVTKGVQVSFENDSGTVHNVYFYNQQRDSPDFGVFCGQVDKGINWQSSVDDVKRAYGQPTAEYSGSYLGGSWRRLVFAGIDFRFENEKMVRIGIPGN